jgi:hypothetical protein
MLRFKKQSAGDTAFTTLTRGTSGFVVVRRYVDNATGWVSAQGISNFPVIFGDLRELTPAANEVAKWEVDVKITTTPSLRAAVA